MPRNFWPIALITGLGLARIPTATAIAYVYFPPAPDLPSCSVTLDSEPIPRLVKRIKNNDNQFVIPGQFELNAQCASEALGRRGDAAVPALISLMKTRDPRMESLALAALCGPGHKGATAFPYIEKRLRGSDPAFEAPAYPVLVCMGDIAKPAIPILIRKAVSPSTADSSAGNDAIATLGNLAQYEPEQVIPLLIRLLDQPAHIEAAAKALEKNGRAARIAQEPLIQELSVAAAMHQGGRAAVLIAALTSVGSPERTAAVLSALLEHPEQTDPYSRAAAVSGLVSVAPGSLQTLQAILDEAVRGEKLEYFNTLESVNPFPPELAPAVVTAIHKLQGQPGMVSVLRTALVHTHTDLRGGQRAPEPTQDIGDRLADGLLALTQQSRPIVVNDLIQQLHLDPNNYDDQGDVVYRRLSHKPVPVPGSPQTDLIDSIDLSEVRQEFDVILKAGYCVSATAVRSRLPAPPAPKLGPPTITVSADRANLGFGVLRFKSAQSEGRCSLVDLGDQCTDHVRIVKTFKDDARCALIPNPRIWTSD